MAFTYNPGDTSWNVLGCDSTRILKVHIDVTFDILYPLQIGGVLLGHSWLSL